ncbi:MAG: EamA family transporter [Rhizobiaceae bacterium]|nr:EamA family transporter [Rhizobiaceae bacterium]
MVRSYLLPVLVVMLVSLGLISLKGIGMRLGSYESFYNSGTLALGTAALMILVASALGWLYLLSYLEVSRAIAFSALTFPFVYALSWCFLGEVVSPRQLFGMVAIVAGVMLST